MRSCGFLWTPHTGYQPNCHGVGGWEGKRREMVLQLKKKKSGEESDGTTVIYEVIQDRVHGATGARSVLGRRRANCDPAMGKSCHRGSAEANINPSCRDGRNRATLSRWVKSVMVTLLSVAMGWRVTERQHWGVVVVHWPDKWLHFSHTIANVLTR